MRPHGSHSGIGKRSSPGTKVGKNHRGGGVKIFDEEGKECPPSKVGLVQLIRESVRVTEGKERYNDGLFGHPDEDGFLYLVGRQKEAVMVGGVNIFPNEIEMVIPKHQVLDVAATSASEKDLGEIPAAVVQLKEEEKMSGEELIEHCRKNGLYGFEIPGIVEFADELPKTPTRKL